MIFTGEVSFLHHRGSKGGRMEAETHGAVSGLKAEG
jgi:hypothetical protein